MLYAVIPAQNEAGRIGKVIAQLLKTFVDVVVPIVNGSTDGTLAEVSAFAQRRIKPLLFPEALGLDVPRAIGAAYALKEGAAVVLFIDGDMTQVPGKALQKLIAGVRTGGMDLSLTNCYPPGTPPPNTPVSKRLVRLRQELNHCLSVPQLGSSSPAHGPHAVSRRFLETVPLIELATPPVALCLAALAGLNITVAATVPHRQLGSPPRGTLHSTRIAATIIGDYLEALAICRNQPRTREDGRFYYDGYDSIRRRDILSDYLEKHSISPSNLAGQPVEFGGGN
ncbi:MAG: glycosyltransferase [Bacillota bacterium]